MIIKKNDKSLIIENTIDSDRIYIARGNEKGNEDGEAGDFKAEDLYDAIDKFFRENF